MALIPPCQFQDCDKWQNRFSAPPAASTPDPEKKTYDHCGQYIGVQLQRFRDDPLGYTDLRDNRQLVHLISQQFENDIDAERQDCVDASTSVAGHCGVHVNQLLRSHGTPLVDFSSYNSRPYRDASSAMRSTLRAYVPMKLYDVATGRGCNLWDVDSCSQNVEAEDYSGYLYLRDPQKRSQLRERMCEALELPDHKPKPVTVTRSCECGHCYAPKFCSNDISQPCSSSADCPGGACENLEIRNSLTPAEQNRMNSFCRHMYSCGQAAEILCDTDDDCMSSPQNPSVCAKAPGFAVGRCSAQAERFCSIAIEPAALTSQADCETMGGRWSSSGECRYRGCDQDADCNVGGVPGANGSLCLFAGTAEAEPDGARAFWNVASKRCELFRERDASNVPIVPSVFGGETLWPHQKRAFGDETWANEVDSVRSEDRWVNSCHVWPMSAA